MKIPRLACAMTVAVTMALVPVAGPTASAMTIDCKHTGPVVGHPDMNYICYVHHDDGHKEIFYAP